MKALVFTLVLAVTGTGCVTLPPEQQAYLAEMRETPTGFGVAKKDEEVAWGRAQSFIGRFSSMKLQTVTDYVIQTYNPPESKVQFGYYVTKTPSEAIIQINVECVTGNPYFQHQCRQNAGMLATYIKTGALKYPHLIRKGRVLGLSWLAWYATRQLQLSSGREPPKDAQHE